MKTSPAPSTATPDRVIQSAAHRGLGASTGRNLHHPVVAGIRDEDIARSIHRHTCRDNQSAAHRGLGAATGRNLHHPVVAGIRDEDIARSIHRHTVGVISPLPTVVWAPPPAGTSTTRLLLGSAMKTSPAASTATPYG